MVETQWSTYDLLVLKKLYKYYIEKYFLKTFSNMWNRRQASLGIPDNSIFTSTVSDQKCVGVQGK